MLRVYRDVGVWVGGTSQKHCIIGPHGDLLVLNKEDEEKKDINQFFCIPPSLSI